MVAYSYIFILITLASGYTSLKLSHFFKYRIRKYSGQELFFSSAVVGLLLAFLGFCVWSVLKAIWPASYNFILCLINDSSVMYAVSGWLLSLPIIFLGLNKLYDNDYSISRYIDDQNDGIERILETSHLNTHLVSITLSTGKVYIGIVNNQSFFSPVKNRSFSLLPMYSGYRDNKTQELVITNEYVDQINEFEEKNDDRLDDFEIALSINSIISVSKFNIDIYEELNMSSDNKSSIT